MTITIDVIFADGTLRAIRDYESFDEAIGDALVLADTHGADPGDGAGPPEHIQVRVDGQVELSIRVFRGGLLRSKAYQG